MNVIKLLLPAAALWAFTPSAIAQDDAFDLSSQRGEVQEFNSVPGQKLDHKGIIINPTPQQLDIHAQSVVDFNNGFKINDRKKSFTEATDFLKPNKNGVKVNIDYDASKAKKAGVKDVTGAYLLTITPKGIDILGYDERGAFYGLQTLRQIIESPAAAEGKLPLVTINDFPTMKYRGVVEGFYGTPWSHDVRMSLIDFYGRNKMNDYLYGPKDDPYHSSPYWRQPYPEDQAEKIKELVQNARRNHVNFIWAIHPGKDIRWNKLDYDSLVNKFNMMYDLGVRSFAIFFDDIEGEGTNPRRQVELLNALTEDFVKTKGDVTNLIVCPTDYSQLWANPGPNGPLAIYGRELNPDVEVFWTGAVVCSDLTHETLDFINSRIKRPALYWWNFPVSDYCKHILLQGPVYGLATDLSENEVAGIESNPMEHGEASKLALYGVADYAWNPKAYNPIDNWERGLEALMPEAAEAYRTFAIHSTDTETGYRRDESWETEIFPVGRYTQKQFDALAAEFKKITDVEKNIRENASNKALVNELSPWLTQFTKLGERGMRTLELIKTYETGNDSIFWQDYTANLMSADDRAAYEAHKIGTMKLQPFYERSMDDMVYHFYHKLAGERPTIYKGIGSYPNMRSSLPKLMLDNDTTTFYTSANAQKPGDWIGIDLGEPRKVEEIIIHQGRNSVDDVDYFDNVILEYSVDGRQWTPLTEELAKTYIISWKGTPIEARYVRLNRLDSKKRNWAAVRSFSVNPPSAERIGLNIVATDATGTLSAFDSNPTTIFTSTGNLEFDRKAGTESLIILSADSAVDFTLVQLDAKGNTITETVINTPFIKISPAADTVRFALKGSGKIAEILQR